MANYGLDDGHGNCVTTGLQEHEARRVAQRLADERGKVLYLYALAEGDGEPGESEEIHPARKIEVRQVSTGEFEGWVDARVVLNGTAGGVTLAPASYDGTLMAPEGAGDISGWIGGDLYDAVASLDDEERREACSELESAVRKAAKRAGLA